MVNVNEVCIDFTLLDSNGESVTLSQFKGKKIILYFYPKDNTPGCTLQAQLYRDTFEKLAEKNCVVIGVNKDSVSTHNKFKTKQNLPFILLSDPDGKVCQEFGVIQMKKLYGKEYLGIVRTTFVIDENFVVISKEENVKPKNDALNVLEMVSK